MNAINLIEKYQEKRQEFIKKVREMKCFMEEHPKFKIGDKISFYGGHNNDILYHSEIIGFDTDKDIFVLWDCYWFPIRDEERRKIKKI